MSKRFLSLYKALQNQTFRASPWLLLLLFAVACPSILHAKSLIIERIIAVVDNDIILLTDWRKRYDLMKKQLEKIIDPQERDRQAKTLRRRVLQEMIDETLLDQKAKKLQITVSDLEVKRGVEDTRKRYNLTEEQFKEALKQQGYTDTTYQVMVRKQLRKLKLLRQVLGKKIQITKEDLKDAYRRATRGVKAGPVEYHLRHIVFLVPKELKDKARIADIKRQATNVLQLAIFKPADFVELAKRFSQGTTRPQGGDLGFLKVGDLDPSIEKAMITLKPKEVFSKLIRSPLGFHILYLENKRSSGVLSYGEAKGRLQMQLQQQAFQRIYGRYAVQLRKEAVIDIRL